MTFPFLIIYSQVAFIITALSYKKHNFIRRKMHPVFYYLFALFYLSAIIIVYKQAKTLNRITSTGKLKSWLYIWDNIANYFNFSHGACATKIYFVLQSIILADKQNDIMPSTRRNYMILLMADYFNFSHGA